MRRRFALWRVKVWDKRLKRARAIWESIPDIAERSEQWLHWEGQVTKALAKRVKWRKRAGIKLRSGGPVSGGKSYLIGEQARKLSPPPDRPEA